jgi:hypothetical protein
MAASLNKLAHEERHQHLFDVAQRGVLLLVAHFESAKAEEIAPTSTGVSAGSAALSVDG